MVLVGLPQAKLSSSSISATPSDGLRRCAAASKLGSCIDIAWEPDEVVDSIELRFLELWESEDFLDTKDSRDIGRGIVSAASDAWRW